MAIILAPVAKVVIAAVGVGLGYVLWPKGQGAIENANTSQTPVNPLTGQMVKPGTAPFVQQLQTSGVAVGSAKALHDYLKAHKVDGSAEMTKLVKAFQQAANSDPMSKALHGPLPTDGTYGAQTSAALTVYTKDPIPPAPSAPPMPPATKAQVLDASVPGAVSISAFNLYSYLKAHGVDGSPDMLAFVRQFQLDFNTDTKNYIGPKGPFAPNTAFPKGIPQTGAYDEQTAQALKADSGEYIAPK